MVGSVDGMWMNPWMGPYVGPALVCCWVGLLGLGPLGGSIEIHQR